MCDTCCCDHRRTHLDNNITRVWLTKCCKIQQLANLYSTTYTVESRFLEPSVSRTSRYLEPNLVSLGFTSLELYNFTPDFSNPRFLETPDNSNQFFFPWDKLTLVNSNLRKFRNNLVRMSITSTPLNKLTLPDKLFSHNKQATNLSSVCKVQ